MNPGTLVKHEQLGLGKVISVEDDVYSVAFLFFWPIVTLKENDIELFIPQDEFKWVINRLSEPKRGSRQIP